MKLYTTTGIAQAVGRSPTTVKQWLERGWLSCHRDSAGRRLFDEAAVECARKLSAERPGHTTA